MSIDLTTAAEFMTTHARLLDRHRFRFATGEGDPEAGLAALDGYRNPDGGYGCGLEPDFRSPESQPGPALHAFEAIADMAPATGPRAVRLCDWLASVSLPDGGLPFALPVTSSAGCAPFWANADATVSSLQITSITAAQAWRVAAHDPTVAAHPWLATATKYCLDRIRELRSRPHAIELTFAVRFLDAVSATHPEALDLLDHLGTFIPADGLVHVDGGAEDEFMRPLDFAPLPGTPARRLFSADVVEADLRRLAGEQRDDGGWTVDFASYSPAAALEWRGYATVNAVTILTARHQS